MKEFIENLIWTILGLTGLVMLFAMLWAIMQDSEKGRRIIRKTKDIFTGKIKFKEIIDSFLKGLKEFLEGISAIVSPILILPLIFYVGPALVILVVNFFKAVVFGDATTSDFGKYFYQLSFERVNIFYQNIYSWVQALIYRVSH